jgi:hypothetical protein
MIYTLPHENILGEILVLIVVGSYIEWVVA